MEEENKTIPPEEEINYTTNTPAQSESEELTPAASHENTLTQSENEKEFVKPKKNLFLKILFGIIAFLILLLIAGAILYFTGFFEHKEEIKKVEEPIAQEVITKPEPVVENPTKFEIKSINSKKLNDQLANLTNKNLSEEKKVLSNNKNTEKEPSIEVNQTKKEELKTEIQKEKGSIEASPAAEDKKELESNNNNILNTSKNSAQQITEKEKVNEVSAESMNKNITFSNQFLLLINVAKIKGPLYKKYLDKITAINPNVKLCRDDKNRIEIYFGPFEKNEDRVELLNKLLKNKFGEAYSVELTQEEFNKRCNY